MLSFTGTRGALLMIPSLLFVSFFVLLCFVSSWLFPFCIVFFLREGFFFILHWCRGNAFFCSVVRFVIRAVVTWDGFSGATKYRHKRVCPFVRPSVRPCVRRSVRLSVRPSFHPLSPFSELFWSTSWRVSGLVGQNQCYRVNVPVLWFPFAPCTQRLEYRTIIICDGALSPRLWFACFSLLSSRKISSGKTR